MFMGDGPTGEQVGLSCILMLSAALTLAAQTSVVTYHDDNARTGRYLDETLLTPTRLKAGTFGQRFFLTVDGVVYAQPLYLSRVKIAGKGFHNVLFVATSHDSLYAFDADDESDSQPLWKISFLDGASGVTTVSQADVGCPVIPELGIAGTPVIDPASGTIYLITFTKESGNQFVYRLHAIDVTNGVERPGSPVEIQPPGFVALAHKQRTGLLLLNGFVYSSWSGHCDLGTYHGWVMAHDAATLQLAGVFNSSPGDSGASFWNGGAGPASDEQGNIYVVSANGDPDGNQAAARYDESVLKLTPAPGLLAADQFSPFNKVLLDQDDLDLGSSGALVLPDEAGSPAHSHLLFTSGKGGRIYLLDREALGGAQAGSDSGALASLPVLTSHFTYGTAAYFNGTIYLAPANSPMLAFPVAGAALASTPSAQSPDSSNLLGATPSISANGTGAGIVWTINYNESDNGGKLLAHDAGDLSALFDSSAVQSDQLPGYSEFAVPTVADGKVFAPSITGVGVYGERAAHPPAIAAIVNAGSYSPDAVSPGSLISLFGSSLAAITTSAPVIPLPLSVADTSVTINGLPAPLLFESPGQINAQVPWEIPAGPATVVVRSRGASSPPMKITVQPAAPGLFADEHNHAAALNADGSVNLENNPASAGSVISVFFTGQGPVAVSLDDGAPPPVGNPISATSTVSATIGDASAQVEFAGLAPLYPGLAQINLKVPALSAGSYPLIVTIGGKASNAALLAISGP
jgi:uncharacterized protein (TIGR03437 family)